MVGLVRRAIGVAAFLLAGAIEILHTDRFGERLDILLYHIFLCWHCQQ
jgi:hypothetical protein